MRICVVVQRYGEDIIGGAETLARDVSERLNRSGDDVTVYTTCAKDYVSWGNDYEPGETYLKGVRIVRFRSAEQREIESFNRLSDRVFSSEVSEDEEREWIRAQGPYCPDLVDALAESEDKFDIYMFFTYLYYPVVEGMKVVKKFNKPVLFFPTAHDEAPIHLKVMDEVFAQPDAIMFLTGAEKEFVEQKFKPEARLELVRTGVVFPGHVDGELFRRRFNILTPYIVYAGRIEEGKGMKKVFEGFESLSRYRLVTLVLMGKKLMDIPALDSIRYVGFVSEEEKMSAFKGARFSVQPSPLESLSITTLESFTQNTPVLVNRECDVLMEHVTISGGGRSYSDPASFVAEAEELLDNRAESELMGEKGYEYAREYYSWENVLKKIRELISEVI